MSMIFFKTINMPLRKNVNNKLQHKYIYNGSIYLYLIVLLKVYIYEKNEPIIIKAKGNRIPKYKIIDASPLVPPKGLKLYLSISVSK